MMWADSGKGYTWARGYSRPLFPARFRIVLIADEVHRGHYGFR